MIVISDTTPIVSLLKIDKLELLRDLFEEVVVPEAVYDELTSNDVFAEEAKAIASCPYLLKKIVENKEAVSVLQLATGLHLGESEALVLANALHADLVLLDERPGREVAQNMDLDFTGTIGILSTAFRKGLLASDEVEGCIDALKQSGRHISEALYRQLIATVGQSRDEQ